MGAAAVAFQRALRGLGVTGEVFASEVEQGFEAMVHPASSLRVRPDDVVLYHHGIASPLASHLLHLGCRRGVVFHNITPARFYEGTRLAQSLITGRAQLAALAGHVEFSIGVSPFNARELTAAGHQRVSVVPLLVEPVRFGNDAVDPAMRDRLERLGRPRVLTVSRVVPHKRVEDLLSLHAELKRLSPHAQLIVVGGADRGQAAVKALERRARRLGGVTFLGRVNHGELVAAYRAADLFVSMSEHEGLGVPLLEAFASDVPVLAFGAAAVPETMGGRGLVFDEKHFAALAEVARALLDDAPQRQAIIDGQCARLQDFSLEAVQTGLRAALNLEPSPPRRRTRKPTVAFVVQRFGEQIVGGAESHARQVALKLAPHARVELFTTCATDHLTWNNELPAGEEIDGPLTVHRFPSTRVRHMRHFNRLSAQLFGRAQDLVTETRWVADQGPVSPALLDTLVSQRERFDAVAFFTSLYQPTAYGVPLLADQALLVPTAHDEPPLAFHLYADAFERPQVLLVNTPEEEALIRQRFPHAAKSQVVGVGVEPLPARPERFLEAFGLKAPYLLYVGRLEAGKGVAELVDFHQRLVSDFHDAPSLVLAGAGELKVRGARVAVGTPVIGNTFSAVVRGQLERSGGGVGYHDAATFAQAVQRVGAERAVFSQRAKAYSKTARWSTVIDAWLAAIDRVAKRKD